MSTPSLCTTLLAFFLGLIPFSPLYSQTSIFPSLSEEELLDSLVLAYKPADGLNYGDARDTLYGRILNHQDSLSCIYTAFQVYLPPGQDPTMAAFDANINTEHAFPRSKGAEEEMARSDMHNLFPSRVNVNADRGDLPFGEVSDQQAISWYYLDQRQSGIPTDNRDAFSEIDNEYFEPRESSKGDIARAMFYFYTMYRTEAELADPDFFPNQHQTLCDWHVLDPVDQQEWDRNLAIAAYQDNKSNPYILDCTLAFRAFCPDRTLPNCGFTDVQDPRFDQPFKTGFSTPNPFSSQFTFTYHLEKAAQVRLQLIDALGRPVALLVDDRQQQGDYQSAFRTDALPAGIYGLQLAVQTSIHTWTYTQKLIKF